MDESECTPYLLCKKIEKKYTQTGIDMRLSGSVWAPKWKLHMFQVFIHSGLCVCLQIQNLAVRSWFQWGVSETACLEKKVSVCTALCERGEPTFSVKSVFSLLSLTHRIKENAIDVVSLWPIMHVFFKSVFLPIRVSHLEPSQAVIIVPVTMDST